LSTPRIIARNILSNWSGFLFQVLITLLLTPYIVGSLGNTYYGIWILVVSLTGYYGLLDLGISASLTQYISRYHASGDLKRLNETASTGLLVLSLFGVVLVIVSLGLALLAERVFEIPASAVADIRAAILILGMSTALQFLFFPYSAVFPATQRFDISNLIGVGTRLLFALGVYAALRQGYGLIGVSIATAASNLADYLIRFVVAYRILPGLKVSFRLANAASGLELAHFAVWNVIVAAGVRLISYTSAVVIAIFMPPAAITPFALASNLAEYFMRIFVPVGQVFFPVFTERDALGDSVGIRNLFLNGTRMLAILAIPSGLMAYWFADSFFSLWIGEAARAPEYPSAASLFSVLIIASVATAIQRVSYQVLLGTRRMKMIAGCFAAEALANVLLSVVLLRSFGLLGVALGVVIPALVIEGFVFPFLISRLYSIRFSEYLMKVYGRPVLIAIVLYAALICITLAVSPASWAALLLDCIIAAIIAFVLVLTLGITTDERRRFVLKPFANLAQKLR